MSRPPALGFFCTAASAADASCLLPPGRFYEEGYRDGFAHGRIHGLIEGRALGREKGFEMWEELGFYEGFARVWGAAALAPQDE